MPTESDFVREVCLHPADMEPRLVFADWCEENGQGERGEFIRCQIHIEKLMPTCDAHRITIPHRVRADELLAKGDNRKRWTMAGLPAQWIFGGRYIYFVEYHTFENCVAEFRNGFPEILTLSWEVWQQHYQALIDAMPVREVRLTTLPFDSQLFWANTGYPPRRYEQEAFSLLYPGHDSKNPILYTFDGA